VRRDSSVSFFYRVFRDAVVAARRTFMPQHCNRRERSVKTLMRRFGLAFLVGSFLGLAGCGADNETEAERLQKKLGEAPKTEVPGGGPVSQPKTQEEYAARQKEDRSKDPMQGDYAKGLKGAAGGAGRR
jgi:hypothetical protein